MIGGCSICEQLFKGDELTVKFWHFVPKGHPLWKYSDTFMHQICLRNWGRREEFLSLWFQKMRKVVVDVWKDKAVMMVDNDEFILARLKGKFLLFLRQTGHIIPIDWMDWQEFHDFVQRFTPKQVADLGASHNPIATTDRVGQKTQPSRVSRRGTFSLGVWGDGRGVLLRGLDRDQSCDLLELPAETQEARLLWWQVVFLDEEWKSFREKIVGVWVGFPQRRQYRRLAFTAIDPGDPRAQQAAERLSDNFASEFIVASSGRGAKRFWALAAPAQARLVDCMIWVKCDEQGRVILEMKDARYSDRIGVVIVGGQNDWAGISQGILTHIGREEAEPMIDEGKHHSFYEPALAASVFILRSAKQNLDHLSLEKYPGVSQVRAFTALVVVRLWYVVDLCEGLIRSWPESVDFMDELQLVVLQDALKLPLELRELAVEYEAFGRAAKDTSGAGQLHHLGVVVNQRIFGTAVEDGILTGKLALGIGSFMVAVTKALPEALAAAGIACGKAEHG